MGEPYCINIRKKNSGPFSFKRIGGFSQEILPPSPWQVIQEHVKLLQDAQHQSLGQVKHLEGCCWDWFYGDVMESSAGVFGAFLRYPAW